MTCRKPISQNRRKTPNRKVDSMDSQRIIKEELGQAALTLNNFLNSESSLQSIGKAAEMLSTAIRSGNKIISCGNGGSHCDAMHFAEELSGRFRNDRKALPAMSISDPSHITCVGNDYGFEYIFSRYVEALGNQGDVLLALTGNNGGKLAALADVNIEVPHSGFADRIQEVHIKIIHILILLIEKEVL